MKFQELIIENFGPYKGRNRFNLRTNPDKPIILVGGKNGAGKTTFFNSIQLCLHGRSAFGRRISQSKYERQIRNELHESRGENATEASITLKFEYGNFGRADEYFVKRSWRDRGKSIKESIVVQRNGSEISGMEEDQWEDFLKELIPPGISQLFFFDGEKIQQLATSIDTGNNFEDSLFSLLGLDLVDRLDSDLSIYLSQKLDESGEEELADEISNLQERINDFQEERRVLEDQLQEKQGEIEEINQTIESKENELAREGGGFAKKRDELKQKRSKLDGEIESVEEQIRDIAKESYPFALAPELCESVTERLRTEVETAAKRAAADELIGELDDVSENLHMEDEFGIPEDSSRELLNKIKKSLTERLSPEQEAEYQLSREFSDREREEMFAAVDEALNQVPTKLDNLTERLEDLTKRRQEVVQKIQQAPDQSVISPIVNDINKLNERKGALKSEIAELEESLEELENRISHAENSLENRIQEKQEVESVSERAELATRARKAVSEYRERLISSKLTRLESALTERYLSLSNKSEYYESVKVDTDNVSFWIETSAGGTVHQSKLSAGERQIFATALLWALADISGRPIPFLVDTPMGRLDTTHRENLIENFFPEAAHQVLLFSTNTEITEQHYDSLNDSIASEYLLEYDEGAGNTTVHQGFFWSDIIEEVDNEAARNSKAQAALEGFSDE